MHTCLICMGSNTSPKQNIPLARTELFRIFPGIVFGEEMLTTPLFFRQNKNIFCNQLGVFHANLSIEEIKLIFRGIEKLAGRSASDKIMEIVKLDIDLLRYDDIILKPKDLQRDYIKKGLNELNIISI